MATTRFTSKDGVRIIDEHDDGRNFFYFADRRLDGFAIRRANGTSFLAPPSDTVNYSAGTTEADEDFVGAGGTVIDGGRMGSARRQRWNRIMLLEWFAWPAVGRLEAAWTTENNNIKKAHIVGALVSWGFSFAQSVTAANNYIPGGTKPTQVNLNDMGNFLPDIRDLMDLTELTDTDTLGVTIEADRVGNRKRDIVKAFRWLNRLRDDGWPRLHVEFFENGFMSVAIGRGTPEVPYTSWEWKYYIGEQDQVARDINNIADKMYKAAKDAADAP